MMPDAVFRTGFVYNYTMRSILILLIIPVVLVVYYFGLDYLLLDFETKGQFGDMFGAANALFSGFAFLGIIYTIYLQRNELALQREELRLTRDELKRSAAAQENSEKALSKQAESLKATAKLNGLSTMVQYEIAKRDKDNSLGGSSRIYEAVFSDHEIQDIMKEIKEIVYNK